MELNQNVDDINNKKFWEELIAYLPVTLILASVNKQKDILSIHA
jgi:hypothetical protein